MASHRKAELRVVGEADRPPQRSESPVKLFQSAISGATNDEAVELVYRLLENLAERCEHAADIAIDSDSRDVENEALMFIKEVDSLMPNMAGPDRLNDSWHVVYWAEHDLEKAMRNHRRRLTGDRTALESFSVRRQRRVSSAWEVERRREQAKVQRLVERADITRERVIEALRIAAGDGPVLTTAVAIAMLPELVDTSVVGRQAVINRVSQELRKLSKSGKVEQLRPVDNSDGRKTCRYTPASEEASGDV